MPHADPHAVHVEAVLGPTCGPPSPSRVAISIDGSTAGISDEVPVRRQPRLDDERELPGETLTSAASRRRFRQHCLGLGLPFWRDDEEARHDADDLSARSVCDASPCGPQRVASCRSGRACGDVVVRPENTGSPSLMTGFDENRSARTSAFEVRRRRAHHARDVGQRADVVVYDGLSLRPRFAEGLDLVASPPSNSVPPSELAASFTFELQAGGGHADVGAIRKSVAVTRRAICRSGEGAAV